jgi:hypothetical protein
MRHRIACSTALAAEGLCAAVNRTQLLPSLHPAAYIETDAVRDGKRVSKRGEHASY